MATSDVQICNSALIKVGTDLIISLADDNKRAKVCQHQYPILRDEVLRSHPWKFATARIELAEVLPAPDFGDYENWFQLPSDCLRVLQIIDLIDGVAWERSGDLLLINAKTVKIKYIKRVTDTTLYDANFSEVLATRIASDLAWSLTQNAALAEAFMRQYLTIIRPSMSFSAMEGSVPSIKTNTWLTSRY